MKGSSKGIAVALGVGLVAAAGALFLYGKNGPKNRKKVRSWALKAKGEVLEKLEMAGEMSEDAYGVVVDEVLKRYKDLQSVDAKELAALGKELKGHWRSIKREATAGAKKAVKKVKKLKK
jgi:hypothetical protein